MQVQFKLVIGSNEFTLIETVESHVEFFKKLNFYSTLPKEGPNGEKDLELRYRVAQGQYEYYSIVCKSAGQEFKFGQSKTVGDLFPKGWEPLYNANANGEEGQEDQPMAPGTSVGLGAQTPAAAQAAPAQRAATPAGLGSAQVTKPAAKAATPPPNGAAPNVQNQAKNVLSKFGI